MGSSDARLPQAVAARVEVLKASYAAKLAAKLDDLREALRVAIDRPEDGAAIEHGRTLAHRLRGTAGSYGFPEVSALAGRVEDLLTLTDGGMSRIDPLAWAELDGALASHMHCPTTSEETPASATAHAKTSDRARPTRILLVTDDDALVTAAQRLGQKRFVQIDVAVGVDAALAQARASSPDGAFIDVSHLADDGFQLARRLRQIEGGEQLPIGFISITDTLESRVAAVHAGGELFLAKPLDETAFVDAVSVFVEARRAQTPRVLWIDDDPDLGKRGVVMLEEARMSACHELSPARALDAVERFRPDLVLLDVGMKPISGFDVCRMIRANTRWRHLPILFVTGDATQETRIACFEAGGDDYIQKPIVEHELMARIRVRLERQRLYRERADRDVLTGLLSRRAFAEAFAGRLAEARRRRSDLCLALLDLDHFKQVNDEYGHLCGDRVLEALGQLLSRTLRADDLRGRWGGEEFIVCLHGEAIEAAEGIIERLLEEFSAIEFTSDDGRPFQVTFSAGVAACPDDAATFEDLLRVADRRLFEAKGQGRKSVVS